MNIPGYSFVYLGCAFSHIEREKDNIHPVCLRTFLERRTVRVEDARKRYSAYVWDWNKTNSSESKR